MVKHVRGGCLKGLKQYEEAKVELLEVLQMEVTDFSKEKHTQPYCCILLGEIAMEERNVRIIHNRWFTCSSGKQPQRISPG